MWYNGAITHTESGRFLFQSADVFDNNFYWAKRSLLLDYRPAVCVIHRQGNKERFVMTAGNGLPCKKCGTSQWYKDGSCVACIKEQSRQWRATNSERDRESKRQWAAANRDKVNEASRRWKAANREKHNEASRRHYAANRDRARETGRQWARNNPEKHNARNHRRRTRKTQAGGSFTAAEWKVLVKHQGGRCLACGKKTKLTADHIVPVDKGGSSDIENIQGLCGPCNSSKGAKTIDYRKGDGFLRWIQKKLF